MIYSNESHFVNRRVIKDVYADIGTPITVRGADGVVYLKFNASIPSIKITKPLVLGNSADLPVNASSPSTSFGLINNQYGQTIACNMYYDSTSSTWKSWQAAGRASLITIDGITGALIFKTSSAITAASSDVTLKTVFNITADGDIFNTGSIMSSINANEVHVGLTFLSQGSLYLYANSSGRGIYDTKDANAVISKAWADTAWSFNGNITGNAMQAERMAVRTLTNIENTVNYIMFDGANPAREYIVDDTCHNMPYDGYWHVDRIGGIITETVGFCKLIASAWRLNPLNQNLSSLEQWEISIDNGKLSGWVKIRGDYGYAHIADNISNTIYDGNILTWAEAFQGGGRILAKNTCTELPAAGWWWIDKHEDSSAGCVLRAVAKDSYATAIRRQSNNTWYDWVSLTDASGYAMRLSDHVANTTDAHGATSAPTASTIILRDADGRAQVATPAADNDIANKSYVDGKVIEAGGSGDVTSASTSATAGNFAIMSGTTGKVIKDSGVAPSDLYASACATQEVTTANVTITDVKKGTLILSGALTGNRVVYLPATVWRKTIICNCTGSYTVRVLATGQTTGGVYLAPGDVAEVYCNGTNIVKLPGGGKPHTISLTRSTVKAISAGQTPVTDWTVTNNYLGQQGAQYFIALQACVVTVFVSAATESGTAGGEFNAVPNINDVAVFAMRTSVGGTYGACLCGSFRVALAAGDKFDVRFQSTSATNLTASSYLRIVVE